MALPDFKKIPPVSISEFRDSTVTENIQIPEEAKNRKCTNIPFLIFVILAVLAMIILVACSSAIGTDYNRFLNGYDKCGDTCGSSNQPIKAISCSGKDLSDKPFMKFIFTGQKNGSKILVKNEMVPDICVNQCEPPNRLRFHRCIPETDMPLNREANVIITFAEFRNDLQNSIITIIVPMSLIGLVLSLCLFLCFWLSPRKTVFAIIASVLVCLVSFTSYIWYWFAETSKMKLFYIGSVSTIVIFFLAIFTCYFHDKYSMVIKIFSEATSVIFTMPSLIFLPLWALIILTIMAAYTVFLGALISTYQYLEEMNDHAFVYVYRDTYLAEASIGYSVIIGIWIVALANACQCMIVAGAVSSYYFTRDKSKLNKPVYTSFLVLMRYHLGTVVFGSLFVTFLSIARYTVEYLDNYVRQKPILKCLNFLLDCTESVVEYLTKRAYIQTAMHGTPMFKSGKRAARLLWANLLDTIALDVVTNFVIICATMFIILVATLVGIIIHKSADLEIQNFWTIISIGVIVCGTVVYFFTQVISVSVETIFICFCEDKLLNNGINKPYFMSDQLKEVINQAKRTENR